MNFDFIRDLNGLNYAFDSCTHAEDLAISVPDLSMVASRKSAEILAKLVYLVSHSDEASELSFADILSNDVVKRYINDRKIMDALHFVRKNGNIAVHTVESKTSKDSLEVLENLHFAFGEVAKRMRLISEYPKFNSNIAPTDYVQPKDINVDEIVKAAYSDYLLCCSRVDRLKNQFSNKYSRYHLVPGLVDLNETIEFESKPLSKNTVALIQEHFGFLAMHSLDAINNGPKPFEEETVFSCELTIYGKNGYTTRNIVEFAEGILYDLDEAEGFKIVSNYQGPSISPCFNEDVSEEFRNVVDRLDKETFTYTIFEFLYNHAMGGCAKVKDGKYVNLTQQYSSEIIDRDFGKDWWCYNVDLGVEFDLNKYTEILKKLQATVAKHIPPSQLEYCERTWLDGDNEILLSSIDWTPRTLRPVQDFLDDINVILSPIISECEGWSGDVGWLQTSGQLAIAEIFWTKKGFELKGTAL